MVHWGSEECNPPLPTGEEDAAWRAALIEMSGPVGLSRITEDNAQEWLWRILFLREVLHASFGKTYWRENNERIAKSITLDIILRWAGLWTNWSNMTRAKFTKHYIERMYQGIDAEVREQANGKPAPTRVKVKRRAKA